MIVFSFLRPQVISSWLSCCWTCWSTPLRLESSTCPRRFTPWAKSSLTTWTERRITTLSELTPRASSPTCCLPESWPNGPRVGCVAVNNGQHRAVCWTVWIFHLRPSLCVRQCESLMPQPQTLQAANRANRNLFLENRLVWNIHRLSSTRCLTSFLKNPGISC